MPIIYKDVKNTRYVYFSYYEGSKKVEVYCGASTEQTAIEKAEALEAEYLQKQIVNLQSQLKQFDAGAAKNAKKQSKSVKSSMQDNIEMQEYLRNAKIFDPEIYYKTSAHMDEVQDNSVQLIVTSPPYNVGKGYVAYDDKKELQVYLDYLKDVWVECQKKLCNGGRIAVNVADTWRSPYIPLHCYISKQLVDLGFLMRGIIYWDKGASVGVSTAWGSWRSASNPTLRDVGEYILVFSKGDYKMERESKISTITANQFTTYTKSLWTFNTVQAPKDSNHPAPFPDELPKRLILLYTYLGDTVLDPFLGSGTTCKVAKALGRKSIGYEIDTSYKPEIEAKIKRVESIGLSLDAFTANRVKEPKQVVPLQTPIALKSAMSDSS
jgi:site-specific DNA-methyltransferase (adenine-specific)